MEQIERESRDVGELRHVPESVMTALSTQEQTNQVGARFIDHEINTTDVEIRLPRDKVRTDIIQNPQPRNIKCLLLVVNFPPIVCIWKNP